MADSDEWFVVEDGCLSVGQPVNGVSYHSSLNTVLVSTSEPTLKVVDVTSGLILQSSNLSANKNDHVQCMYLPHKDKVLFSNNCSIGMRKDFNGMLLLDTALQTPVSKTSDHVKVELPLPEANHLFRALMSTEMMLVDYVEEVLRELEKEIEVTQQATKGNHKAAKWATVCVTLPHCALKTVCSNLVAELKRLNQHIPALSVAFTVYDRLSYLLPSNTADYGNGLVDRTLMYSEAARRETFSKWPHMNYKWALPDPMAQAGFYHQPSTTGDDRAMCFTCNVCLVCWEPTDEPWSEHERHSPSCAFVKGEYTQNVPLSVTYATEPASLHGNKNDKIECVSATSNEDYVATSTLHGNIVVWSIARQLKKHVQFNIDPLDPVIIKKMGSCPVTSEDNQKNEQKPSVKEAWPENHSNGSPSSKEVLSDESSAEIIEVGGAWRTSASQSEGGEDVEIPLDDMELIREAIQQSRPSPDVRVSSLCMVKPPPDNESLHQGAGESISAESSNIMKPCLISGVGIRTVYPADIPGNTSLCVADSERNNVAAMNQVNQALSGSTTPQIIPNSPCSPDENTFTDVDTDPFIPCLLVHDVSGWCAKDKQMKEKDLKVSQGSFSTGKGTSVSGIQDLYMPQIVEMEEDLDVQIVGVTPPPMGGEMSKSMSKFVEGFMNSPPSASWMKNGPNPPTLLSSSSKVKESSMLSSSNSSGGSSKDSGFGSHNFPPPPNVSDGLPIISGQVIQCIKFPEFVSREHYVKCIVPSEDGKYVIVVLSPRVLLQASHDSSPVQFPLDSGEGLDDKLPDAKDGLNEGKGKGAQNRSETAAGGCILVYRLKCQDQVIMLDEQPIKTLQIKSVDDAVTSILPLPLEVSVILDEEEPANQQLRDSRGLTNDEDRYIPGQISVTTWMGSIRIINLDDMRLLAEVSPEEDDRYVTLTFCSGLDRLCACTANGKLHFYFISPKHPDLADYEMLQQSSPLRPASWSRDSDNIDGSFVDGATRLDSGEELLVKQQLNTEVLTALHELTQFENLMPRFSATAPPCWTEIQQEQQQRRHPQHLQQRGEATRHTRTWRLQPDSTSWDDHLFELVLPRPCCIGHIDFKFSLHPLCTSPPNVQITLLKQNISNIGRQINVDVDSKIHFNIKPADTEGISVGKISTELKTVNNVLDPEFLEKHGAEILCGPLDINTGVDLSGHSGMLTLTSPQLLKVKSRSLLLHIKALHSGKDDVAQKESDSKEKSSTTSNSANVTSHPVPQKDKTIKSLFEQFGMSGGMNTMGSACERLASKQKLENIKGCDWFQEVSLTVRRTKKTTIPRDRLQRCAILELPSFHEQLLVVICGNQDEKQNLGSSAEHRQSLALGVLTWITFMQMNDPQERVEDTCIVYTIQSNLKALVKACFIEANRSIAHKCTRLLALVIEFTKNIKDPDVAPAFNYSLLNSLLDMLPIIAHTSSAGALHWFFILLNRVKFMDIKQTGQKCADVLINISKHYYERMKPEHALLKARFGLYGSPLDPDLFDLEPPQLIKPGASLSSGTYASIVSSNNNNNNSTTLGSSSLEEIDYKDLMHLTADKSGQKSHTDQVKNHFCGLLEVEPLHFTCHATSDGTRMERMDTAGNVTSASLPTSGLSGTINFAEGLSSATAAGAALASLSTAMASAEQQLQMLQQKQQQLMKLQQQKQKLEQKLAESSSKIVSTGSAASTQPSSGFSSYSSSPYMYSSELLPPTPKTTPLFMTPPVTPPDEHQQNEHDPGKPPTGKATKASGGKYGDMLQKAASFPLPQSGQLLQPPAAQVLVIERMHSGARRFVVLDFGKPILLTDLVIPACSDLASLSIDVWVHGEELDGQRLVVSSDIGIRSLIMNDMMPPQICRYLKITTIGRSGGGTTRSRVPIGSFYGHSFILPWEMEVLQGSVTSVSPGLSASNGNSSTFNNQLLSNDQTQILSQMSMLMTLQEDIQCRYSLACNRLEAYLQALDNPPSKSAHTHYYLQKNRKPEEDAKITHAYNDCIQLQVQLNLAQRAIQRLQRALGIKSASPVSGAAPGKLSMSGGSSLMMQVCTDKLRVLTEHLLHCLLSMTNQTTAIPQLPVSLHNIFNLQVTESLFKNLCIFGTKQMQVNAGTLLVRLSGTQAWWGEFLGNVLQEYFSSQFSQVVPQDRVFILLTALGQKALTGSNAGQVLENILVVLVKLLTPLQASQNRSFRANLGYLDLSLIGWVLLFLSRNLDSVALNNSAGDDADKSSTSGNPNRWDFILSENTMNNSRHSVRSNSAKLYRRKLQKRLMHHKQQLLDLQQAKKKFLTSQLEKASIAMSKEAEALIKQQEHEFKKNLRMTKTETKHFMRTRHSDRDLLKKLPKDPSGGSSEREGGDTDAEAAISLCRDKATAVSRGLIALLLSMDFTCDVDLFLVTCKVVARLCTVTRPAIKLSEVMTQEELESLMMLCGSIEYNHDNASWGVAWTSHAITCLLQDILEGERLYPNQLSTPLEGVTDDEMSGSLTESEDASQVSTVDESESSSATEATASTNSSQSKDNGGGGIRLDKESALIVDMLLDDAVCDEETNAKLTEYLTGESMKPPPSSTLTVSGSGGNMYQVVSVSQPSPWGPPNANSINMDDKKERYDLLRSRLFSLMSTKPNVAQGISTAMDARLEYGVDTLAELRLKVMLSLEAEIVQTAVTAPLPSYAGPTAQTGGAPRSSGSHNQEDYLATDNPLFSNLSQQNLPSSEMLSQCFNNLFVQLQLCRVNLDTLLNLWLTLNEDTGQDESGHHNGFHPSHTPSIPLKPAAVTSLLQTLAWTPNIPVKSWVLSFQTLSMLTNLKCSESSAAASASGSGGGEQWLASIMVADSNLVSTLVKFLSGSTMPGPLASSHQYTQVGPTATKAFYEFLVRLQLRCAEANENHLKELMLKLVYTLTSESGAFHKGLGPLDAQCKLLDYILDQNYHNVDVNNAISVIESISLLVHQHILSQEQVSCRSSSENSISARSCFGRLFTSLLHTGESNGVQADANRDSLMCSLLRLVSVLVQMPLPGRRRSDDLVNHRSSNHHQQQSNPQDRSNVSDDVTMMTGVAKSDEEKSSETDEQKTEISSGAIGGATSAGSPVNKKTKSCAHFTDVRNPLTDQKEACLSDIILGHQQIITNMLQTLSHCNSNTMAVILASSGLQNNIQDVVMGMEPLSVGDGIYQILCTMNRKASDIRLVLQPILKYLSAGYHGFGAAGVAKLSEPLLWYMLRVLDCETTLRTFLEMGGVEIVCNNLVYSNRRTINTIPTLISTIMQYLGNSKSNSPAKKMSDSENTDGVCNFAPLGTITSSSPTAGPAEVLIQASPPHRRARSAAWSYHFYPDEAWVDLTIYLPCAVLLKEVQIQPHLTSLATCPSFVSVEVSCDGSSSTPVCSPITTSGLTFIKIQLLHAEVVNTVTIRLHRPRDSTTIGLSQILLMGQTVFGNVGATRLTNLLTPTDDFVSQRSMSWLRLLHHCLTHSEEMQPAMAAAASPTPNLLVTCCALLVAPNTSIYAPNIEAVLLKMGLHSVQMGLALIDNLLRNTSTFTQDNAPGLPLYGKVNGMANESTVDILFKLGMSQDEGTFTRMKALMDWLGDSARVALQRHSPNRNTNLSHQVATHDLPAPAPSHVHCIATILWKSCELPLNYDITKILTNDLLSSVFEWSTVLKPDSALKRAMDWVICAMCYVQTDFFSNILEWMGIAVNHYNEVDQSVTDDLKDSSQQAYTGQESLTDDCKKASAGNGQQGVYSSSGQSLEFHEYGHMVLDVSHLATLAAACQSPRALNMLLASGFPLVLCHELLEFCTREVIRYSETVAPPDVISEAAKSKVNSRGSERPDSAQSATQTGSDKRPHVTADLVAPILKFLTELGNQAVMKDWLGGKQGSVFWKELLSLLCNTPSQTVLLNSPAPHKHKVMTGQQRAAIETATVEFLSKVLSCHSHNQVVFAQVLCDVIKNQGHLHQGIKMHSPLTGFTRRLFLQVLLEDEKILVSFKSAVPLHKNFCNLQTNSIQHPVFGTGHKYCTISTSLSHKCSHVLSKVSNMKKPGSSQQTAEGQDDLLASPLMDSKDSTELGIEVVDQLSVAVAGLSAKEKRDKSGKLSSVGSSSKKSSHAGDGGLASVVHMPVLSLYHSMLPGQPLPADLTMSQLLVILHQHGFPHGYSALNFSIGLRSRKTADKRDPLSEDWMDTDANPTKEKIPPEVLLDTAAFPSALQVFASEGGLALLAEHLPLLYPEVTRQVTPPEVSREQGGSGSIGHDWVTVESGEDVYEEIYEAMPPSHPSQSSRQSASTLPTIPPHSLVAFGLFLRLPGYAEVLLKERKQAQCLLRLVLGVTDDGDGGHILSSPMAGALPTLPFNVLKTLFDSTPLTTDDGMFLRRKALEIRAMHLILACLSVLSHHAPRIPIPGFHQEIIVAATQAAAAMSSMTATTATTTTSTSSTARSTDDKGQSYWAKGTGFGTGSTSSSWDAEQALLRQKSEEEHVTCLLQVIASYINPGGGLPKDFESASYGENDDVNANSLPSVLPELLSQSCLVPAISSYLRNDSVLDMARHVPLYLSLLELLRGIAACSVLLPLLLPLDQQEDSQTSVSLLLEKMKMCVDTYTSRLKSNKTKENRNQQEEEEAEGLQLLIPDIQETARIVHISTHRLHRHNDSSQNDRENSYDNAASKLYHSDEQRYMAIMKEYQFDTYEMVVEKNNVIKFAIPHHYESNVKAAGDVNNASRARRLAQETVTLSTSLPLSASSSVFVRCDEERLDVMKVLITGPSDTPYANGCFDFDVYFPQDYPNSPPLINMETTGNHTVRFNPNLYNDGKVCLSVLNTWHGRPEEKWNPQTSSFLQVLVSIQSLILVSEPYFNEPGYERSRGTPSGTASSREYDANIRQASVKWGMLEMLRNPPACFKDVIKRHFWMKRHEIIQQCEEWIADLEINSNDKRTGRTISQSCVALKRHFSQLKEEFAKMKPSSDLDDDFEEMDTSSSDFTASTDRKSCNYNSCNDTTDVHPDSPKEPPPNTNTMHMNSLSAGDTVYANGEVSQDEEDELDSITNAHLVKSLPNSVDC